MELIELRIRNWVSVIPHLKFDEMCLDEKDFKNLFIFKTWDRIKPITITKEWLEKLGFNKDGYDYWTHGKIYFELAQVEDGFVNSINCHEYNNGEPIRYVHELQNLFYALTKTELTTK